MPMLLDQRASGSFVSRSTSGSTELPQHLFDSATFLELTYGLRTGKAVPEHISQVDERDIYSVPKGAGIAATLEYRKKFIERQVTKSALAFDATVPTHFILSDLGNEFANCKFEGSASTNRLRYGTNSSYGSVYYNAVPTAVGNIGMDGNIKLGGPTSDLAGYISLKSQPSFVKRNGGVAGITLSDFRVYAQRDISVMNPIKSHASVLTTLLELVRGDVPGVLKQLRQHVSTINTARTATKGGLRDAASATGGSYLENVFGWTPIMRDINNAVQVLTEIDQLLFPPESTRRMHSSTLVSRQSSLVEPNRTLGIYGLMNPTGSGSSSTRLEINRTAHGSPLSSLPTAGGVSTMHSSQEFIDLRTTVRFQTNLVPNAVNNGYLDKLQYLLGLNLTPETIWELTPWSWLIDWFTNIGLVVENLSNIHTSNLILNYAYSTLCRKTISGAVVTRPALTSSSTGYRSWEGDVSTRYTSKQKVRLKASPYGFSTALTSLSGAQWAILVALGLARQR